MTRCSHDQVMVKTNICINSTDANNVNAYCLDIRNLLLENPTIFFMWFPSLSSNHTYNQLCIWTLYFVSVTYWVSTERKRLRFSLLSVVVCVWELSKSKQKNWIFSRKFDYLVKCFQFWKLKKWSRLSQLWCVNHKWKDTFWCWISCHYKNTNIHHSKNR